jgi:hypothetical protein
MKNGAILGRVALVMACAGAADTSFAQSHGEPWQSQVIGAPPSQPLASPGLYRSASECAPDRAEPEWDKNYKFLGYACVRQGQAR